MNFLPFIEIFIVAVSTTAGVMVWAIVSVRQTFTKIRSKPEREEDELAFNFDLRLKELRVKFEEEKNQEKKQEIEEEKQKIRKEHEAMLNRNLQRADGSFVTDWRESLVVSHKRLLDEEKRLLARNRANLRFGIIAAILGFYFLTMLMLIYVFIFSNLKVALPNNFWEFLMFYVPLVSGIIIIEIPAIFFLNLYASNERRLERNKSDLTNIELRLTAGLMLRDEKHEDKFADLAKIIAQEDSKFVLGKNESSAGINAEKLLELLPKIPKIGT